MPYGPDVIHRVIPLANQCNQCLLSFGISSGGGLKPVQKICFLWRLCSLSSSAQTHNEQTCHIARDVFQSWPSYDLNEENKYHVYSLQTSLKTLVHTIFHMLPKLCSKQSGVCYFITWLQGLVRIRLLLWFLRQSSGLGL